MVLAAYAARGVEIQKQKTWKDIACIDTDERWTDAVSSSSSSILLLARTVGASRESSSAESV